MQNLKKKVVQASVDDEHKPTEIFVMLPLDIIAVGEFKEGEPGNPFSHVSYRIAPFMASTLLVC